MKTNSRILLLGVITAWLSILGVARAQTVLWSDSFDDGNGNNLWYADMGVWQIGSPTIGIGPGTNSAGYCTHSGPYCATTGLTADYPSGMDSRLIRFQSFAVPAANQYPRLRFWQWYNFGSSGWGSDYGVVEIRVGTSAWQAVSPQYTGFSGDWTYASVDLSAFAGQTVQVAFHAVDGYGTGPGWYVDDISVITGTPVFNNPEGFEAGIGDWYAEQGTWQVGSPKKSDGPPTNSVGARVHSGTNCAVTLLNADYPASMDSRFISPPFAVPAVNQYPRLRFWQWYNFGSSGWGSDYGVVEIRVGTNAWQALSPQYTSYSSGWTEPALDLSAYSGQTVQLAFHAVDGNSTAAGWYVDDISVITGTPIFNNPEGFEAGSGDWYAEQGIWQVGSPTKSDGPPINSLGAQAHSGTNCAVTLLSADYPANMNSRFISPAFAVPAANQYPRLRFWQWYNFGSSGWGSDYGVVEVRVGTNAWQAVSPQYTGFSGDWTYASVDLSAFAGHTVQLAFYAVGGFGTGPGWYVDDISVITGTPVFNNPEGFEAGIGDWYAEQGTWQVGSPKKSDGPPINSVGARVHSGTNCAVTLLNADYPASMNSRFISAAFAVPASASSPYLRFWQWYSFGSSGWGSDYGVVEIRVGTNAWQALSPQYTGYSSGWTEPALDLSAYAGQTVQVAFHAVDGNGTGPGWYVDDVYVQSFGQPVILTPPASQTVSVGTSATLFVGAAGDSPLIYQWRYNSNSIVGATNTSLAFANLQLANTGYYDVVVTNLSGSVTSTPPALLRVVISFAGSDIGDPGAPGSFTKSNNAYAYSVTGSGEDIVGTADAFYFIQQPLNGDCQIVARVTGLLGGNSASQAGIMIRESLTDGSKHASLLLDSKTNVVFRRRLTTNAPSIDTAFAPTNHAWLRLMRMGNTCIGFCSTNGTNWEYVWSTTINESNQVQVGLAVTAHQNGSYATANFDNVSIGALTPLPGTWPLPGPKFLLGGETGGYSELQRVGGYKFLLGGVVGEYDTIKATTNLATAYSSWSSLVTVTNTYGVVPILDAGALTNKMKYYRAQKIGP
jgi:regulation of enolase protein 1 (concanavalin A-like superfamily)